MREWERSFEQELSSITSSHHLKVSELTSRLVESDGRLKQVIPAAMLHTDAHFI